jgi:hypothetical protein
VRGLIAIIYHEAGFAGSSGGFQISAVFSMIAAGMCLRHIQVALRTARAPVCLKLLPDWMRVNCQFYRMRNNGTDNF